MNSLTQNQAIVRLIIFFTLVPLLLYGSYWLAKHGSYWLFYESMVEDTIRDLVKSSSLIGGT